MNIQDTNDQSPRSYQRLVIVIITVLLVATGFFLLRPYLPASRALQPSDTTPVFLISIDTLRSDHLPAYGYTGVSTPNLDALRADGILYRNAFSHTPLTLPSHATVLTGTLPADNGVRDNVGFRLREDLPTLPEILKKNGYTTGAAVSAYVLRKETGIARGFDFFDDDIEMKGVNQTIGRIQRGGAETIGRFLEWIERVPSGKTPFFLLHLYEPHTPYEPPEPFLSRYTSHYDGEIAYTDKILGHLFDTLKSKGLYDKAMIIVFSDHGEGLGDHREDEHGIFLYREAIQVPLIVKLPSSRLAGTSVETTAQLSDIFPTVIAQTASTAPARMQARSLLDLIEFKERRSVYSETYYPKFHFGWSDLHSISDGAFQYIQAPKPELYDLYADPGQKSEIREQNRRVYNAMRSEITPFIRQAEAPAPVDPEEAAKMAALGYIGSTVQTDPKEVLPDPKDKIETFIDIRKAFTLARNNQPAQALEMMDRLLLDNRRMLDLWALKSRVLLALGRPEDSIEAAKEGLRLAPATSHLIISIANTALELNRLDEAEQHADLAVEYEPAQGHELLARIWIARGNLDRADAEARLALDKDGDRVISLMTLARVEKERKNYEAALGLLDQSIATLAKRKNRSVSNLHFLRGDLLARVDRNDEAEVELRKEIEISPEHPQAYKNLILLYVTTGRLDEGTALIFKLVEAVPTPPGYLAAISVLETVGDDNGVRYWARRGLKAFPNNRELRSKAG